MTELTAGKEVVGPHLNLVDLDIEAGRDASALVQTTVEVNHDLSGAVVINHSDIVDVTLLLHALKELQEHLGARADEDLAFTTLLGVGNGLKSVGEDVHQHGFSLVVARNKQNDKRKTPTEKKNKERKIF